MSITISIVSAPVFQVERSLLFISDVPFDDSRERNFKDHLDPSRISVPRLVDSVIEDFKSRFTLSRIQISELLSDLNLACLPGLIFSGW